MQLFFILNNPAFSYRPGKSYSFNANLQNIVTALCGNGL